MAALVIFIAVPAIGVAAAQDSLDDRRISGRVVDPNGRPVVGAHVMLWTPGGTVSEPARRTEGTTTTAADGTFDFRGLFPTRYMVDADAPGHTSVLRVRSWNGKRPPQAFADVSFAGARHASNVVVTVYPIGTVSGRITRPDGTPVRNAVVSADMGPAPREHDERPVKTDANGRYQIDRLPVGAYTVSVRHSVRTDLEAQKRRVPADYRDFVETFYPGTPDAKTARQVEVRAGQDTPNIDMALALERQFTIVGRILDESGRALSPLWLEWGSVDGEGWGHDDLESYDGSFAIRGVLGEVGILARADTDKGPLIGMTAVRVTTGPVRGVFVRLAPPARVRGRVVVEGGAKLPGHQHPAFAVVLRTRWPRVECLSDVVHKTFPENFRGYPGEDGKFEIDDVVGDRIVDVEGLPAGWRVKEVRRRGRVLPDGRLLLHPRDLITDIEVVIATR